MSLPGLFDVPPCPLRARLENNLRRLAAEGVYIGTSSWKYEGWLGQIFTESRYATRGKFSRKKFEETCIAEYGEVFPIVRGFRFLSIPVGGLLAKAVQHGGTGIALGV